jgi:hypothetical protein
MGVSSVVLRVLSPLKRFSYPSIWQARDASL